MAMKRLMYFPNVSMYILIFVPVFLVIATLTSGRHDVVFSCETKRYVGVINSVKHLGKL